MAPSRATSLRRRPRLAARPETADAYELAFCLPAFPSPSNPPASLPTPLAFIRPRSAYRGNDRPKPSQFIGRQSPRRRAKWQRLTMMVPIAAVHLAGGYERLIDSL